MSSFGWVIFIKLYLESLSTSKSRKLNKYPLNQDNLFILKSIIPKALTTQSYHRDYVQSLLGAIHAIRVTLKCTLITGHQKIGCPLVNRTSLLSHINPPLIPSCIATYLFKGIIASLVLVSKTSLKLCLSTTQILQRDSIFFAIVSDHADEKLGNCSSLIELRTHNCPLGAYLDWGIVVAVYRQKCYAFLGCGRQGCYF